MSQLIRRELVEVVHAFGTGKVRNSVLNLGNGKVAYSVGARVALTGESGDATNLTFLSVAAQVQEVMVICVDDAKKFLCVCHKVVGRPNFAYATVYHLPSLPRPTRAKTLVYDAPSGEHHVAIENACFSRNGSTLVLQLSLPQYSVIGYDWKHGSRVFAVDAQGSLARIVFSPQDAKIIAACGDNGFFCLWRHNGGELHALTGGGIEGLPADQDYTDVAWLAGDRLVVTSKQGRVHLVSPAELLQTWVVSADDQAFANALHTVVVWGHRGFAVGGAAGLMTTFAREGERYTLISSSQVCSEGDISVLHDGKYAVDGGDPAGSCLIAATTAGDIGFINIDALFEFPQRRPAHASVAGAAEAGAGFSLETAVSAAVVASTAPGGEGFHPKMEALQAELEKGSTGGLKTKGMGGGGGSGTSHDKGAGLFSLERGPIFRPVVSGFGVNAEPVGCLAVCSRRKLLAGITRPAYPVISSSASLSSSPLSPPPPSSSSISSSSGMLSTPELRLWNYRTKALLVRHPFNEAVPTGLEGESTVVEGACPLALAFHPMGYTIAVGFTGYVSLLYVTGGQGCIRPDVDVITKGIFRCPGDAESVLNHDPVSSLRFSCGGHLLAVVTGRIVQMFAMCSSEYGGKVGRVQVLAGHTSDITHLQWSADDRRCFTTCKDGAVYEWKVGSHIDPKLVRQREFIRKGTCFESVGVGIGREGGVVAGGLVGSAQSLQQTTRNGAGNAAGATTAVATTAVTALTQPAATTTTLFVFPKVLNATGEGVAREVPFHLKNFQVTSYDSRFPGGAHNSLIAGSDEGMAIIYDWSTLIRTGQGQADGERDTGPTSTGRAASTGTVSATAMMGETVLGSTLPLPSSLSSSLPASASTWAPSGMLSLHDKPITDLVLSADNRLFFTASEDGIIFMSALIGSIGKNSLQLATGVSIPGAFNASTLASTMSGVNTNTDTGRRSISGSVGLPTVEDANLSSTAEEVPLEERLSLMDVAEIERVQTELADVTSTLKQQEHSFNFKIDRAELSMNKELAAMKLHGVQVLDSVTTEVAHLTAQLKHEQAEHATTLAALKAKHEKALATQSAQYESRLGTQAEAYLRLKMAFEDLGHAAQKDGEVFEAEKDQLRETFSATKRAEVEGYLEERATLREYVDFLKLQYANMLKKEEAVMEKELHAMRAKIHVDEVEHEKENEKNRGLIIGLRKQIKTLEERAQHQAAREVEAEQKLDHAMAQVKRLESAVQSLEGEVQAKNQRLSEWEHMARKQEHDMKGLDKLKAALTMEVQTQRERQQEVDAELKRLRAKASRDDALIEQGVEETQALDKALASRNRQALALKKQLERTLEQLRHREACLLSLAPQLMEALKGATDGARWLVAKTKCEKLLMPLLDKEILSDFDVDAPANELMRQRARMTEGISVMKRSLELGENNHKQQNFMRITENQKLTEDVNDLRKRNKKLEDEVKRLKAEASFMLLRQRERTRERDRRAMTAAAPSSSTGLVGQRFAGLADRSFRDAPMTAGSSTSPLPVSRSGARRKVLHTAPNAHSTPLLHDTSVLTKTSSWARDASLGERVAQTEAKLDALEAENEQLRRENYDIDSEKRQYRAALEALQYGGI